VGWVLLGFAILFEIVATSFMKMSEGLTRPWPSAAMVVFYLAAFSCLALALKTVHLSVAYAIWSGVGTALIAVISFYVFEEPMPWTKVASLFLIVIGVVGLNLGGGAR